MKNQHLAGLAGFVVFVLLFCLPAHASLFQGEALDSIAEAVAWMALIIAPIVVITVFWLVHILPEKIAEQKKHPQAKAIQTLCLLSLFFGGLLWPLAWLWAYSKPVLYKMAYGTDTVEHESSDEEQAHAGSPPLVAPAAATELESLRMKVAAIEAQLARRSTTD